MDSSHVLRACDAQVEDGHVAIACEYCDRWFHTRCTGMQAYLIDVCALLLSSPCQAALTKNTRCTGLTREAYTMLTQAPESVRWACHYCAKVHKEHIPQVKP
eukprot:TRINITY_DN11501_c0_g2_i7.p2 TRINITY_DN11501_c0_g2~~TRINITY_DN11501_c0_g2_i7.p2  ORF type:complete len:102 (+),score=1.53 TRINITY_DN11501_c0_g2_i7:265-570(+)